MKILLFGKDGQLGRAFQKEFKNQDNVKFLGRSHCDLANPGELINCLASYAPELVINTAAYTAVDLAESNEELAFSVNGLAPKIMAEYCASSGLNFIHFSTDYVFNGEKNDPYLEGDYCDPINIYGKSKYYGEQKIESAFQGSHDHETTNFQRSKFIILRSTWIYGEGNNFIHTIIKLAKERDQLSVINDQFGVPVSAVWLAKLTNQLISSHHLESGIYHAVPRGKSNWYEIAKLTLDICRDFGIVTKLQSQNIRSISSSEYPLKAKRPKNSILDTRKLMSQHDFLEPLLCQNWEGQLRDYIQELKASGQI